MGFGWRSAAHHARLGREKLQCSLSRRRMVFAETPRRRATGLPGRIADPTAGSSADAANSPSEPAGRSDPRCRVQSQHSDARRVRTRDAQAGRERQKARFCSSRNPNLRWRLPSSRSSPRNSNARHHHRARDGLTKKQLPRRAAEADAGGGPERSPIDGAATPFERRSLGGSAIRSNAKWRWWRAYCVANRWLWSPGKRISF